VNTGLRQRAHHKDRVGQQSVGSNHDEVERVTRARISQWKRLKGMYVNAEGIRPAAQSEENASPYTKPSPGVCQDTCTRT
jgi:hypothetical protein